MSFWATRTWSSQLGAFLSGCRLQAWPTGGGPLIDLDLNLSCSSTKRPTISRAQRLFRSDAAVAESGLEELVRPTLLRHRDEGGRAVDDHRQPLGGRRRHRGEALDRHQFVPVELGRFAQQNTAGQLTVQNKLIAAAGEDGRRRGDKQLVRTKTESAGFRS